MSGPLDGVRIVELAGLGPAPFCGMMLADMGAEVVRVDRADTHLDAPRTQVMNRGRRSLRVDLKHPGGAELVLRLVDTSDGLIEGFRPGVAERLGLGPDACLDRNPRLVYGRVTGYGQAGPDAGKAGHDLNYLAVTGALAMMGRDGEPPMPPLNMLGDFGGGGMLLAFGMVCGLFEALRSGRGQVLDAAMVDGVSLFTSMYHGMRARGAWSSVRGENVLDTGAPFYDTYECSDGRYVAIGASEPKFYAALCAGLGLDPHDHPQTREHWATVRERFAAVFKTRTQAEWRTVMDAYDTCFAPVVPLDEVAGYEHHMARASYAEIDGVVHPSPAPRFSRTPGAVATPPPVAGEHTDEVLSAIGCSVDEIAELRGSGVVA